LPRHCPCCDRDTIVGHGRRRKQAHDDKHDWIWVRRGRCPPCKKTFTVLPVWSPPSGHYSYECHRQACDAVAKGKSERIPEANGATAPGSFSPDGKLLADHQLGPGRPQIWVLPLDTIDPDHPKSGKPELFPASSAGNFDPAFSPDGHWLAYASNEEGPFQICVRPYPAIVAAGKWQVSIGGGRFRIWSRNPGQLFFESLDGHIMVSEYTTAGMTFSPGRPRQWSDTAFLTTPGLPNLDLAPDGKRFAIIPASQYGGDTKGSVHATFLLNFFDELKRRFP